MNMHRPTRVLGISPHRKYRTHFALFCAYIPIRNANRAFGIGVIKVQSNCSVLNVDPDEIVWGCEAIGKVINRDERQAYHLLSTGKLPAQKIGAIWVSTKGQLLAQILRGKAE
jgi:hypothetical protein